MGWYVAFCIVLGIVGGLLLDKKVGTSPLFMLIGTVLGAVVAFYGIYKMVAPLLQNTDLEGHNNHNNRGAKP